jgi:hypothetical protein
MTMQNVPMQVQDAFTQYGPVGTVLLVLLLVIRTLYNQLSKSFDDRLRQLTSERDYERKRAEDLVVELKATNAMVQEKTLAVLGQATAAVADVTRAVRELQR